MKKHRRLYRDVPVQWGDYGAILIVKGPFAGYLGDYDDDGDEHAIVYLNPAGIVGAVHEREGEEPELIPYEDMRSIDDEFLFRWVERRRSVDFPQKKGRKFVVLPGSKKSRPKRSR
jgi:hypothetical protein